MGLDGAEWGEMGMGWEGGGALQGRKKVMKNIVKNFYNRNIFSIFAVELRFLRVSQVR